MSHGCVRINPVSRHDDFFRFEPMPVHDAVQHCRIRLAENDVRFPAGSVFNAFLQGAAVHQHGFLVGRAYAVRIRRHVRNALAGPPCCAAESRIGERGVECYDQYIRHIFRVVAASFESGLLELADHAWGPEHEKLLRLRISLFYIIDCSKRCRIHVSLVSLDSQSVQLMQIICNGFRRVVCQE